MKWIERMQHRMRARKALPMVASGEMLRALNRTRHSVLASSLEVAATGKQRRKGLLGHEALRPGEGLWIVPCESVHTFFMRFPIDLVYLDRKHRVRKIRKGVVPWRLSACLTAHSVLELAAGAVERSGTAKGDALEILPAAGDNTGGER